MDVEIHAIDSHTAGEPTRVVIAGGPSLTKATVKRQCSQFQQEFDHYRAAVVTEPRGSDVMVGAYLCEPQETDCDAGVIFFNNVGFLGMCGHGMIGVVETLRSLGRICSGDCRIETPVGVVVATAHDSGDVSVGNVESYRVANDVKVDVEGIGAIVGDVAYGGNWFFLAKEPRHTVSEDRVGELTRVAVAIRRSLNRNGFPHVDHVELFGDPLDENSDSRNFVLCPGLQYDRSPCGTGTSAKLACLAADGRLSPGTDWVQEGILGTSFIGRYEWADDSRDRIRPTITGRAHITADVRLKLSSSDPFRWGIPRGDTTSE
ncbi:MAG: proline racemase family protein [Rubripirellula sp.]